AITSVQAVYVPADDLSDPAVAQTFVHLDASIVLSRTLAARGLYPAIDPLASTSRLLDPARLGQRHYQVALRVKETIERYRELEEMGAIPLVPRISACFPVFSAMTWLESAALVLQRNKFRDSITM